MVRGKWYPMGADIALPVSVRERVFGRGRDPLDDEAWQVAVFDEGAAVGCARLWWRDGAFWLGDVGVLESRRGQGYGDLLVRLLLFKALTHNASVIRLEAPDGVRPFFARYGFASDGEGMRLNGADVRLDGCAGCKGCE